MSLSDYLTKYFPNGTDGEFEGVKIDLVSHFIEKFGVHVKNEGDLYLFKYDQLLAKFSFPITHECRGHIWRFNGTWNRVANPPNKFFNDSEGYCPIFNNCEFEKVINQLSAYRKEDGTLCTVWFDTVKNDWRCSTSGMISPMNVGDFSITFDTLFWNVFGLEKKDILSQIGKEYTFCFELCSNKNRIVTKYVSDRVYLLIIRHVEYGTYIPIEAYADMLNVKIPQQYMLYEFNIKSKDDLVQWVEKNCTDDTESEYKEGFVIYHNMIPIAKVKTGRYRALHGVSGADLGATRNNCIELFFNGAIDDVYGVLVDEMKLFVDNMRAWYTDQCIEVMNGCKYLSSKTYSNQKEYAMEVLKLNKTYSSFYFAHKEMILNKILSHEIITFWFSNNYKRFIDTIKTTCDKS